MKKNITSKQLDKIANLSRISLTEQEKTGFTEELEEILEYFNYIQEAPVEKVDFFDHYNQKKSHLRQDEVEKADKNELELIKGNFPRKKDDFLKVDTVLKNGR
ncbi:MAG: Asp-tRNA(Asn)/Glu-tRNA(Gln) amidotransferase subunit GatC [Patescibacteria group bacterium]